MKNGLQSTVKELIDVLQENEVEIYGDETVSAASDYVKEATEEDWSTEYLGLSVSVKIVESVDEAIAHINKYGTKHSESIVTNDEKNAATLFE